MRTFILGVLLLFAVHLEAQRTLSVPADYPTIQAGIDAAQPGDTVLVSPSVWLENLDFKGKAITVRSAEGPALTVIDGRRLAPAASFTTGETRASVLSGFTLRNGGAAGATATEPAPHSAGALLRGASPTLSGNIFSENLCAAVDAVDSAPLLQDNQITRTQPDTSCSTQAIAPIVLTGTARSSTLPATLLHNTVEANDLTGSATQPNASAIALLAARAVLQGNIVRNNAAVSDAPAVQVLGSLPQSAGGPMLIQENLIYGNVSQCGPALFVSAPEDANSTGSATLQFEIVGNTLADQVLAPACPSGNVASELVVAPGLQPSQLLVANNILAGSSSYPALSCAAPLPAEVFHHNLLHNTAGSVLSLTCPDSNANLLTDPLFVDRSGHDYHLSLHSSAVDAGSNAVSPRPARDLESAARLQNATGRPSAVIDLGAFEYPAPKDALAASVTVLDVAPSPGQAFQSTALVARVTTAVDVLPVGSVSFMAGARVLGTVPLDATGSASFTTTSLPAGPWNVVATYSGSPTLEPSTSAPLAQTVSAATTLLAFSLTPSTVTVSQPVVVSAQVTAPLSTHIPSGSVQFFELPAQGSPVLLGTSILDAGGLTTFTLPALPEGQYQIMATYPGTADFAPAVLPKADALTLTVSARGYLQTLSAPTLTLQSSHHGPLTVLLTSLGSFADTLSLSCANLPSSASCSFTSNPAALTAGGKSTVTLTVDTDAIPGFARLHPPGLLPGSRTGSTLAFAGIFSFGFLLLRRTTRRHRARLGLFSILLAVVTLFGCGAGQYPAHTPPGTYQIDIVSRAAATGQSQDTPLTLIVTP